MAVSARNAQFSSLKGSIETAIWRNEEYATKGETIGAAVFEMIGKIEGVLNDERKRKKERLSRGVQLSQEA